MTGPVTDEAIEAKRLAWQCRRGMRELDEMLGRFLEQRYTGLGKAQRQAFRTLLDYPDPLLLECLMGRMLPADADVAQIVRDIRDTAET